MAKQSKQTLTISQMIWGILSFLSILAGLTLGILGFLRDMVGLPYERNWIRIAENAMNEFLETTLSWQTWGSILLVIGAVIFALLMTRLATQTERELEKSNRRAQRLQDAKIAE
jgi:TM2 domain-containing membrane protein YozV